jgi:hypothetical protein
MQSRDQKKLSEFEVHSSKGCPAGWTIGNAAGCGCGSMAAFSETVRYGTLSPRSGSERGGVNRSCFTLCSKNFGQYY